MTTKTDGGPAFPIVGTHEQVLEVGMTLRDYFAAKAMQARLTDYESCKSIYEQATEAGISFAREVALQAYDMADAMLKARENT